MSILKAVEVQEKPQGSFWACYLYRRSAETEYKDERDALYRINCVEPNKSRTDVFREARRIAQANNVPFINLVDLRSDVPLVESFAKMEK